MFLDFLHSQALYVPGSCSSMHRLIKRQRGLIHERLNELCIFSRQRGLGCTNNIEFKQIHHRCNNNIYCSSISCNNSHDRTEVNKVYHRTSGLPSMPPEMIFKIAFHLEGRNLISFSHSCRKVFKAIGDMPGYWEELSRRRGWTPETTLTCGPIYRARASNLATSGCFSKKSYLLECILSKKRAGFYDREELGTEELLEEARRRFRYDGPFTSRDWDPPAVPFPPFTALRLTFTCRS